MSTHDITRPTDDFFSDSEDELDWEEVVVPQAQHIQLEDQAGPSTRPNIEVTLEAYPTQRKGKTQKKSPGGISHAERLLRIDCHKAHTVALIANASTRNKWINDELLQARLLSLTPLPIQNSFAMIHKSRIPDDVKRGYLFEQAVLRLASWWADTFFTVRPTGHLRSRTFEDVQRVLLSNGLFDLTDKGKGKALYEGVDSPEDLFEDDQVEVVRSAKSLMKHALMRSGSRDVSSQLFTALCRALGIPARLVVSLQSVPWQANVGRSKTLAKQKGSDSKGKAVEPRDAEDGSEDVQQVGVSQQNGYSSGDDVQIVTDAANKTTSTRPNGKGKMSNTVQLRISKSSGQRLGSSNPPAASDPLTTPPVFWTEVFSRPDVRWLPVDPIRAIVNKRKVLDPTSVGTTSRSGIADNRMMYVLAVEEDGYMRDVTPRYAKQYSAKVAKAQSGGRGRREWWSQVVRTVTRPYRLHRDDVEDDELIVNQFTEGMPTTMTGFKDHPFYVLERHLHRDQVISVDAHELGKFRGEPVYSRSQVLHLKAAENWMRHGRVVRAGEQPLKYVKQRAATLNRRRELEVRSEVEGANGGGAVMQGLYSEGQTEAYIPPPVIDGKIPKNNFGNIDLYTRSMLPAGAAYIPHKGAAKIARQLGFDHAEAVTSFEFRKGKAYPVISGIVVVAENEDIILEAYWEAEHAAAQKEQEKRQQAVLNRWTKLVHGLRIRQRMREQYGGGAHGSGTSGLGDVGASSAVARGNDHDHDSHDDEVEVQPATVGGFLTGVEDVVRPYSLPRPVHVVFSSPPRSPNTSGRASPSPALAGPGTLLAPVDDDAGEERSQAPSPFPVEDVEDLETDTMSGLEEGAQSQRVRRIPKSMAALAAEAAEAEARHATAVDVAGAPQICGKGEEAASTTPLRISRTATHATGTRTKTETGTKSRTRTETKSETGTKSRTRTETETETETKSRSKTGARAKAKAMTTSSRKRARTRDNGESASGCVESGSDGGGSTGRPRVAKRARKHRQVPVPSSDRVLRTRKGKSPALLAQEREQELAVQRALVG
ncbi:Rad4-domain-containing protein [Russula ochroleuca]|uniref:Rad4-domain-containing protein n=1 Tax=Russula ochroleuca TaxID=152965 RepID=A0A9P5JWQ9_9AGAM|nr:Rad4-domain-containing protein [Russula ochroleuca]